MSLRTIASNTSPLCFLPNGRLICYQHGDIVALSDRGEVFRFSLINTLEEKTLGHFKILVRFQRLGVRAAVAIDNENILLSIGNVLYELNLITREITKGYDCGEGIRPLLFSSVNGIEQITNGIYFGGYVHNFSKDPVNIYRRKGIDNWEVVYTFPKGSINHVHNIVSDHYRNCLWILTGDFEDSAAIWKVTNDFNNIERVVSGSQKWRGCVAFALPEGLLYATDAPFAKNHIHLLKENKTIINVANICGPCIYGCMWKDNYVFATAVEPDGRNESLLKLLLGWKKGDGIEDYYARIYCGNLRGGFKEIYKEKKDILPFIFQFASFRFPAGVNDTNRLFFQPIATVFNDLNLVELSE